MRLILHLLWQQMKRHPRLMTVALCLHILLAALWVMEPLYSSYAIDQLLLLKQGTAVNLPLLFGVWGMLFVAISATDGIEKYVSWEVDNLLYIRRREEVYAHALQLDVAYHTSRKSGETVKVLDEGADNLLDLQRSIFVDIGPSMLAALAFLFFSFRIQPILAVILVLSLLLYTGIVIVGVKRTARLQQDVNKIWVEAVGRAYDAMTNILSVKSGAQEGWEMKLMEDSGRRARGKQRQVNRRWAFIEAMNFFMLTRLLLVAIGVLLYVHNLLTLGELYFFQFSFFRVLTPFELLGSMLPHWNRKVGKVRLAQDILETPIAVESPEQPTILPAVRGTIIFRDVCFSYAPAQTSTEEGEENVTETSPEPAPLPSEPEAKETITAARPMVITEEAQDGVMRDKTADEGTSSSQELQKDIQDADAHGSRSEVLHSITLEIRPGEHVAFVGHSGAGKTTLAMLLNRFYDITQGSITVDGADLRSLDLRWWRTQVGLVLQENIMFNDTIEENIRYARREATLEDVREAARRAAAAEFIESLPEGYKTFIGDRGIRLSGGQRQRLAIARAILKNPTIVILDEATSALDSVTEKRVQEGIAELIAGRTAVIIAHRLSTVRAVDRIAVLDKGQLIAFAPHEELVRTCPIYKEMVELQSQGMLAE